jgi:hypothetical protein
MLRVGGPFVLSVHSQLIVASIWQPS